MDVVKLEIKYKITTKGATHKPDSVNEHLTGFISLIRGLPFMGGRQ